MDRPSEAAAPFLSSSAEESFMFVPQRHLLMSLTKLQLLLTVTVPSASQLRGNQYDCNGGSQGRVYHSVTYEKHTGHWHLELHSDKERRKELQLCKEMPCFAEVTQTGTSFILHCVGVKECDTNWGVGTFNRCHIGKSDIKVFGGKKKEWSWEE